MAGSGSGSNHYSAPKLILYDIQGEEYQQSMTKSARKFQRSRDQNIYLKVLSNRGSVGAAMNQSSNESMSVNERSME